MKADILLKSKAVFTGLKEEPEELAVAISGNKIMKVGPAEQVWELRGEHTKVIDAGDKLIMPGFFDAHLHVMLGSLFTHYSVSLAEANSAQEAAQMVKEYADKHPHDEWIIGTGWDHTAWGEKEFPSRRILDQVLPDRPVVLLHAEGHYGWVNSLALNLAGITKETKNPDYGIIYKDKNGEPTGILIETAISLATDYAYDFPKKKLEDMLQQFLEHAAQLGVTSVNDLYASRAHEKLEAYHIYKEFDEANRLTTRLHIYPSLNGDMEKAKELRERYASDKLRVAGLKQFIDGVVTGYTAYMIDPYTDRPETKGETAYREEELQRWVVEADKEGFQIRFHSIGDGAVRLGLDLYEKAREINGKRESRHCLEHIEIIAPEDIPRFRELGVMPSIQPYHMALMPRESHTTRVKKEKLPYIYSNASLVRSGAVASYSSDYPIVPLNPMLGIYHAVTRKDFTLKDTWNEQEKVTLGEALKAYTSASAYSVFREDELGTIEEGKLADIIVLDRNLFQVNEKEILEASTELTLMDGQIVWDTSQRLVKK
ncbi:amidohydrolase [Bacillus thermotolerans]|uniref:Exoenzymes regulatory protein AepA n=1 Tax=Bacillus thermotolerans TaxID=1221996 RepID=A0A0F5HWW8_BACTR|nr:amidohydrolase [Bacillus thermotolerans]KKB37347.1 Exoenzymes regulatory protein AepA precursor [Bacillus thermotolerans]